MVVIFSISCHLGEVENYLNDVGSTIAYLFTYALHYYIIFFFILKYVNCCLTKQAVGNVSQINDEEEQKKMHPKMKNEAFRVRNAFIKQMSLKGKYGLSKMLLS
jgi:hypothetical protein